MYPHVTSCQYPGTTSSSQAEQTGKQLWASEDMSTYNDLRGVGCWARIVNQVGLCTCVQGKGAGVLRNSNALLTNQ
jgi:hypothetical protein